MPIRKNKMVTFENKADETKYFLLLSEIKGILLVGKLAVLAI